MDKENNPSVDRRREKRDSIIKWAKIIFGDTVIDCVALDISANGARVRTVTQVSVPKEVVLQLSGSGSFIAHQRWSKGLEIGFQFAGLAPDTAEHTAIMALSAFKGLPLLNLNELIQILRAAKFLDDPALKQASDELDAAYDRFWSLLRARIAVP